MRARGEVAPARRAGIIFSDPGDNAFLSSLDAELRPVLYEGEGATRTSFELAVDDHDMHWVILEDGNFQDLVSSTYTVGNAMSANGASESLLAAVFEFYFTGASGDGAYRSATRSYWIYRYDLKAFYPFVPVGDSEGERDRPTEMQLAQSIRKEGVRVESSLEEWLGLWGIPF